ncbi:SGNH/GDSL hydrolase family protein [Pseudofulvibacter geojedonensis]|uniref:SGNH/GDSL hydrolase family protein n=1 Tax=Pseudofulvibacter geojedonensis TaxID=1123758 RepID=A0ABW3I5H0_9FLAO
MKKLSYIAIAALGLIACEPEFDNTISDNQATFTAGDADFSKFVSIGNSLTSGFADGALYIHGQENSFPNILAGQFSLVGGGDFTQPLMNDNIGGLLIGGSPVLADPNNPATNQFPPRLVLNGQSSPVWVNGASTTETTTVLSGPFNNMGVPGAKSFHLVAPTDPNNPASGYGNPGGLVAGTANPYYVRFASSPSATVFGDALAQNPTFFSLWIGNNDILSFATSGGVGVDQNAAGNMNAATYGSNDISHSNVVAGSIQNMINGLTAAGTNDVKGVVCNIPSVTDIPYFTTVPYNAIPMDQATADATNSSYSGYNLILGGLAQATVISSQEAAARMVSFSAGQNPALIVDETLTDIKPQLEANGVPEPLAELLKKLRPATPEDLLVLPSRTVLGTLADDNNPASVIGVGVPLEDKYVLIPSEQNAIATAQNQYNASISAIAAANNNVVLVDMASHLNTLNTSGISYNGGTLFSTYATGGAFSLDGVHPTAQGYAVIANKIIDVVNAEFNANIPMVNPGEYTSIFFE